MEDESLTKDHSFSSEVASPANRNLPKLSLYNGIKSLIDNDSDENDDSMHQNHNLLSVIQRKRANSNCLKYSNDNSFCVDKNEEYQKKFKTEICKNFQLKGTCQWGELVD